MPPQYGAGMAEKKGLRANTAAGWRSNRKGENSMKEETRAYVGSMLAQDLECRRADLDRVLLQGGDGKRELERYRAALLAMDDFTDKAL